MKTVVTGLAQPGWRSSCGAGTNWAKTFSTRWGGTYHMAPAPHSRHSRVATELNRVMLPLAQGIGLFGLGVRSSDPLAIRPPREYGETSSYTFRGSGPNEHTTIAAVVRISLLGG